MALKSKNNYTGRGIHHLSDHAIQQLYNGDFSYIQYEELYLQRRFHPEDYILQMQMKQRHQLMKFGHRRIKKRLEDQYVHDIQRQKRFNAFSKRYNSNKPLLILDVDNTLLSARFFADEMRIGDKCTYFMTSTVPKNNAMVEMLQQTFTLIINNTELIDLLHTETITHSLWIHDNKQLQQYRDKEELFLYEMSHPTNSEMMIKIPCKVSRIQITGCVISLISMASITEKIEIDFTCFNECLSKLEPCLMRPGFVAVDFVYEGFLVRLRPNVDEFLECINDDFNVVIFTAAAESIYNGLLNTLHQYIKKQIGRESDTDLELWTDVLFRNDCTLKYDLHNKPYHHKDITLFGCHLSRVCMVDNSPIVLHKQEPNAIFIKDFFGKNASDDELMRHVFPLLEQIADIKGDIRYFLCSLEPQLSYTDSLNLADEEQCRHITQTFLNCLKFNAPSQAIGFLLSQPMMRQPEPMKRSTEPIASDHVIDAFHSKKRAHTIQQRVRPLSPLLEVAKQGSCQRHTQYSTINVKIEDKFDFDIGEDPHNAHMENVHNIMEDKESPSSSRMTSITSLEELPKNVRFSSIIGIQQYSVSDLALSDRGSSASSESSPDPKISLSPRIELNVYSFCSEHCTDQEIVNHLIKQYTDIMDAKICEEEKQNIVEYNIDTFDGGEFDECEEEMMKRILVLKQWKYDVIKSYCYAIKPDLYPFDEQQQQFFYNEFEKLISYLLNLIIMNTLFEYFESLLQAMTGKHIAEQITVEDLNLYQCEENYLIDFEFVLKELIDCIDGIADNESMKYLCERSLGIINKYYNGQYVIFASHVMIQLVLEMIDGNATQHPLIHDAVSALIVLMNHKKQFLHSLYEDENNKNICERMVAVIALNMPSMNVKNNNDALRNVMKVCGELNIKQSTIKIIQQYYTSTYFNSYEDSKQSKTLITNNEEEEMLIADNSNANCCNGNIFAYLFNSMCSNR